MIESLVGPLLTPFIASTGAAIAGRFALSSLAPQVWAAKVLAVLLCAGLCVFGGWKLKAAFDAQEKIESVNMALAEQDRRMKVVTKIETKLVQKIEQIKGDTITIIKEVPVYVTATADAGCTVTSGFVELYNSAVESRAPRPAPNPDAPAEAVKLSTIASNAAENYGECYVWRAQVEGWQEFYSGLRGKNAP